MELSERLKSEIRKYLYNCDDESLPLPIADAQVCASYFNDKVIMVSHGPNDVGVIFESHKHEYDHIAICGGGIISVEIEGQKPILLGNLATCLVPAGKKHTVIAIENTSKVICLFTEGF